MDRVNSNARYYVFILFVLLVGVLFVAIYNRSYLLSAHSTDTPQQTDKTPPIQETQVVVPPDNNDANDNNELNDTGAVADVTFDLQELLYDNGAVVPMDTIVLDYRRVGDKDYIVLRASFDGIRQTAEPKILAVCIAGIVTYSVLDVYSTYSFVQSVVTQTGITFCMTSATKTKLISFDYELQYVDTKEFDFGRLAKIVGTDNGFLLVGGMSRTVNIVECDRHFKEKHSTAFSLKDNVSVCEVIVDTQQTVRIFLNTVGLFKQYVLTDFEVKEVISYSTAEDIFFVQNGEGLTAVTMSDTAEGSLLTLHAESGAVMYGLMLFGAHDPIVMYKQGEPCVLAGGQQTVLFELVEGTTRQIVIDTASSVIVSATYYRNAINVLTDSGILSYDTSLGKVSRELEGRVMSGKVFTDRVCLVENSVGAARLRIITECGKATEMDNH